MRFAEAEEVWTRPEASPDGGEPRGFNWKARGCVEVADECPNAGEVMCVEGGGGLLGSGLDGGDGVVFGSEREAPQLGAGGVSLSFK